MADKDWFETNRSWGPDIMKAASEGDTKAIDACIDAMPEEKRTEVRCFALTQAAVHGDIAYADKLIKDGAKPSYSSNTPLRYASMKGHAGFVEYLLGFEGIDVEDFAGHAVYMAADGGHLDVLKLLSGHKTCTGKYFKEAMNRAFHRERQEVINWLIDEKKEPVHPRHYISIIFMEAEKRAAATRKILSIGHPHLEHQMTMLYKHAAAHGVPSVMDLLESHGLDFGKTIDDPDLFDKIGDEDDFMPSDDSDIPEELPVLRMKILLEIIKFDNATSFRRFCGERLSDRMIPKIIESCVRNGARKTIEVLMERDPSLVSVVHEHATRLDKSDIKASCEVLLLKSAHPSAPANRKGTGL